MISCASTAGMPPAPHNHASSWAALLQQPPTIKPEPMDDGSFAKEQNSGFYSEGFHSASPSSSSKDSNGHSPNSVGSSEPLPYYDNMALNAKANLSVHLGAYQNMPPFKINLLTPPDFESRAIENEQSYNPYSPKSLAPPNHVSTPLSRSESTLAKSPLLSPSSPTRDNNRQSLDHFQDSGFEGVAQNKPEDEDGQDGSGLEDFDDEPGVRIPAVNSHGKVKTFKCKQCEFVAVTKLSFWQHTKEHIKPEKMLCCRKCPFVTEYKHHLEYHMRNHLGSKPFQCTQCSYSCVNKSMLNSHLKSHSNIYQYRCSDCNYATKYCHSLKLHLRKYKHSPAMVLNVDGTPNPLPIIDVYGTRRGPKQKPFMKMFDQHPMNNNNKAQPLTGPSHPLFGSHFPVNLPYLPPMLQHPFLFPPNNSYESKAIEGHQENQQDASPRSILQQRLSYRDPPVDSGMNSPPKSPARSPQAAATPCCDSPATNDALDLTNTKISEAGTPPPSERPPAFPLTPTTSLKNRRKGPAFKLQPAALRQQHEDNKMDSEHSDSESDISTEMPSSSAPNTYSCQYCDITFGDLTMHTIHMGFHGYNDPFMCNKCGERSPDRVAFFIHLGRAQHA